MAARVPTIDGQLRRCCAVKSDTLNNLVSLLLAGFRCNRLPGEDVYATLNASVGMVELVCSFYQPRLRMRAYYPSA